MQDQYNGNSAVSFTEQLSYRAFLFQCEPALKSFNNHWSLEQSVISSPRTNIVAERALKVTQELNERSRSDVYLNYNFIATNKV